MWIMDPQQVTSSLLWQHSSSNNSSSSRAASSTTAVPAVVSYQQLHPGQPPPQQEQQPSWSSAPVGSFLPIRNTNHNHGVCGGTGTTATTSTSAIPSPGFLEQLLRLGSNSYDSSSICTPNNNNANAVNSYQNTSTNIDNMCTAAIIKAALEQKAALDLLIASALAAQQQQQQHLSNAISPCPLPQEQHQQQQMLLSLLLQQQQQQQQQQQHQGLAPATLNQYPNLSLHQILPLWKKEHLLLDSSARSTCSVSTRCTQLPHSQHGALSDQRQCTTGASTSSSLGTAPDSHYLGAPTGFPPRMALLQPQQSELVGPRATAVSGVGTTALPPLLPRNKIQDNKKHSAAADSSSSSSLLLLQALQDKQVAAAVEGLLLHHHHQQQQEQPPLKDATASSAKATSTSGSLCSLSSTTCSSHVAPAPSVPSDGNSNTTTLPLKKRLDKRYGNTPNQIEVKQEIDQQAVLRPAVHTQLQSEQQPQQDDHSNKAKSKDKREVKEDVDALHRSNKSFPQKMYFLLQEMSRQGKEHVVSFVDHGKAFMIHKPQLFETEIMPLFFASSRLASFQRQLNIYGFVRISDGPWRGAYKHPSFRQGEKQLVNQIKRQSPSSSGGGHSHRSVAALQQQIHEKQQEEERRKRVTK
ncbi:hypothetical protein ACA910_015716 [Epithemia clementina (nom. ined.)]